MTTCHVALFTGGGDKPYAVGITEALTEQGLLVDFIGSNELDCPEVTDREGVTFLNLRGDQGEDAPFARKVIRILVYYARLARYTAVARPRIFHILWNSKFQLLDRVVLMLYYRLLGKRVVLTAHNVNAAKRDSEDTWFNRFTLEIQYRLCHHIFVHTARMKTELAADFGVSDARISVIPFGINNTIPTTSMTTLEAKRRLGIRDAEKTVLFFGQIGPYKGLHDLISALSILRHANTHVQLVIAGKVKPGRHEYWEGIQRAIQDGGLTEQVVQRIQFIPDAEVEPYFKAADVIVMPYTHIFQSGIPFLAYSFGLPVICTDVGSLSDDVIDGVTGFVCPPNDPAALASAIVTYFSSELYASLHERREKIRRFASEGHSWRTVGEITKGVYAQLLAETPGSAQAANGSGVL